MLGLVIFIFFPFQETEIGKAVNHVRKHSTKQIRHLAQTLIEYEFISLAFTEIECLIVLCDIHE